MSDYEFPFSGPVIQSINPLDLWIKSVSQLGFINIRNVTSNEDDQRIEQEVIENVAGYGRQLGRITDVLMTIIENPGLKNLTQQQQGTVDEFRQIVSGIEKVKKKWKSPGKLLSAVDAMVMEINKLKSKDPDIYDKAVNTIIDGLKIREMPETDESVK